MIQERFYTYDCITSKRTLWHTQNKTSKASTYLINIRGFWWRKDSLSTLSSSSQSP